MTVRVLALIAIPSIFRQAKRAAILMSRLALEKRSEICNQRREAMIDPRLAAILAVLLATSACQGKQWKFRCGIAGKRRRPR